MAFSVASRLGIIRLVTRRKHALQVTEVERAHIRGLYLKGVRLEDIVRRTKRSMSVVQRAVRGLKRQRPAPTRGRGIQRRDEQIVARYKADDTLAAIAMDFELTPTRVWQIVSRGAGKVPRRVAAPRSVDSAARNGKVPVKGPRLSKAQRLRRNRTIMRLRAAGVPASALARRFQITPHWVACILKATRH